MKGPRRQPGCDDVRSQGCDSDQTGMLTFTLVDEKLSGTLNDMSFSSSPNEPCVPEEAELVSVSRSS